MNVLAILAGGTGNRMHSPTPKQFMKVGGRTIIEMTIDVFDNIDGIDEMAVVVPHDYVDFMVGLVAENEWGHALRIIEGGAERYHSSLNAIMAYIDCPDDTNIIFHDAARPLVERETVEAVLDSLKTNQAVGVGIPATDTLWEVSMDYESMTNNPANPYIVTRVPERKRFWQAQTPQGFRLPIIRDAYQRAMQDGNFQATDDCGVVRRYMPEVKVHLVMGTPQNFKVTYPEDIERVVRPHSDE